MDAGDRDAAVGLSLSQDQQPLGQPADAVLQVEPSQAGTGVIGGQRGRIGWAPGRLRCQA